MHSEKVYSFEPSDKSAAGEYSIRTQYEYNGTKYGYDAGYHVPGCYNVVRVDKTSYEEILTLKNNTNASSNAIFFEKIGCNDQIITYYNVIFLDNYVVYSTHYQSFEVYGYSSEVIGSTDNVLTVRHTPSFPLYFINFILGDLIFFSAILILIANYIERKSK